MDDPTPVYIPIPELGEYQPEHPIGEIDQYVMGILRRTTVEFTKSYPDSWMMKPDRTFRYIGFNYQFLGVLWWDFRYQFKGDIVRTGPVQFSIQNITDMTTQEAAWWRKTGFRVIHFFRRPRVRR